MWPADDPTYRDLVVELRAEIVAFAERLLGVYAQALGLPADSFPSVGPDVTSVTYNKYPTWTWPDDATDEDKLLLLEHADGNTITVLHQAGGYPGLQVQQPDGSWSARADHRRRAAGVQRRPDLAVDERPVGARTPPRRGRRHADPPLDGVLLQPRLRHRRRAVPRAARGRRGVAVRPGDRRSTRPTAGSSDYLRVFARPEQLEAWEQGTRFVADVREEPALGRSPSARDDDGSTRGRRPHGRRVAAVGAGARRMAAGLAADAATEAPAGEGRRWRRLVATDRYEAWVIAWPHGTGLALHDHAGSAAGVAMVAGRLRERYLVGQDLHTRWWTAATPSPSPPTTPTRCSASTAPRRCRCTSIPRRSARSASGPSRPSAERGRIPLARPSPVRPPDPSPSETPHEPPGHLNLFVAGHGYHEASWRLPTSSGGPLGLDHFVAIARLAERGVLDSIFFADSPGVAPFRTRFMAQAGYDPIDLLAALTAVTSHVGLIATASTTYGTPWDVARRFATLDHLSAGRAGWNIVTTGNPVAAANFGDRPHAAHDDRYRRAQEFVEVVRAVWDGWDDDAVVADAAGGWWADPAKLHPPDHHGEHYSVAGDPRLPALAAGPPAARPGRVVTAGRRPRRSLRRPRVHPAVDDRGRRRLPPPPAGQSPSVTAGAPTTSARCPDCRSCSAGPRPRPQGRGGTLQEASDPTFRLFNLANLAGVDPAAVDELDPDGPFPYELFERAATVTFAQAVMRTARQDGLTFRQTAERFATLPGGLHLTGTPEQLADLIETWWRAGAADGFTLQPLRLPLDAAAFVDHVVPILQSRQVAATAYGDGTLRDRLGLPRPPDHARRAAVPSAARRD